MKRPPNSKSNLERAISRYVDHDAVRANELAVAFSNVIVWVNELISTLDKV